MDNENCLPLPQQRLINMRVSGRQQNIRGRKLSGHKNNQTTMIYAHVSNTVKRNIISSMEDLNLNMDKNPDKFWGFVGI